MRVSEWLIDLMYGPEPPNVEDIMMQLEHDREIVKAMRQLGALRRDLMRLRRPGSDAASHRTGQP